MRKEIGILKFAVVGLLIAALACAAPASSSSGSGMGSGGSPTSAPGPGKAPTGENAWSLRPECVEACSCNLFCMCYFQTHPDGERFCEFNMAVKIHSRHVGNVTVAGEYFWMSGDLGGDST